MTFRQVQKKIIEISFSHPISFITTTVGASVVAGLICLNIVEKRMEENPQLTIEDKEQIGYDVKVQNRTTTSSSTSQISRETARVRAMIENAKESDWKQNLSNVIEAQHQFMLPNDSKKSLQQPDFIKKIDRRTDEMMKLQHQQVMKERQQEQEQLGELEGLSQKRKSTTTNFGNKTERVCLFCLVEDM